MGLSRLSVCNMTTKRLLLEQFSKIICHRRSPVHSNAAAAADDISKARKILVMAGAGLSTPSGIPDFRTKGTGIYDNLAKYNLPYPEAIFDIDYFRHTPQPFNTWAKEFFPGVNYKPSIGHLFIKLLDMKHKLLRLYTQNIDGLESVAGLSPEKVVAAHGGFSSASCIVCQAKADLQQVKESILSDQIPKCTNCQGYVKPDIVFFGEQLPQRFWTQQETDLGAADYLICIGTSLEVYPFAGIADSVVVNVPRLSINQDRVGTFGTRTSDRILEGDLVKSLQSLAETLGWTGQLKELLQEQYQ